MKPTMKPMNKGQPNYAMVGAIVLSLFCWLGLYAVWADFGETGVELLRGSSGVLPSVEGAILIALNAFGLLALGAFGLAAVALLARTGRHDARDGRRMPGTPR